MRYVMFDLEFQGHRSKSQYWHIYFFEFQDINLVGIDTKITFLSPSRDIEKCLEVKMTPSGPSGSTVL